MRTVINALLSTTIEAITVRNVRRSKMYNTDCAWMTIIKDNPGNEYWCDRTELGEIFPECRNCEHFISTEKMLYMERALMRFLEEIGAKL